MEVELQDGHHIMEPQEQQIVVMEEAVVQQTPAILVVLVVQEFCSMGGSVGLSPGRTYSDARNFARVGGILSSTHFCLTPQECT